MKFLIYALCVPYLVWMAMWLRAVLRKDQS